MYIYSAFVPFVPVVSFWPMCTYAQSSKQQMLCFNLWQRNNLPQCVRFFCCCFVSTTKLSFECIMLVISLVFLPLFTKICSPIEGIIKMFFSKWEFSNCKSFLIWGKFLIWLWFFSAITQKMCVQTLINWKCCCFPKRNFFQWIEENSYEPVTKSKEKLLEIGYESKKDKK